MKNHVKIGDENDGAEIFLSFSNTALDLVIKDTGNYSTREDSISDPVLMAERMYSEHTSIVAIKPDCMSDGNIVLIHSPIKTFSIILMQAKLHLAKIFQLRFLKKIQICILM